MLTRETNRENTTSTIARARRTLREQTLHLFRSDPARRIKSVRLLAPHPRSDRRREARCRRMRQVEFCAGRCDFLRQQRLRIRRETARMSTMTACRTKYKQPLHDPMTIRTNRQLSVRRKGTKNLPNRARRHLTRTSLTFSQRTLLERLSACSAGGMKDDVDLRFRSEGFWGAVFEETRCCDVVATATE